MLLDDLRANFIGYVLGLSSEAKDTATTQTGLHETGLLTYMTEKPMSSISLIIFYITNCLVGTWILIIIFFTLSLISAILQDKLKQSKIKQTQSGWM